MLIVDTREKKNEHVLAEFDKQNTPYIKQKLDVGDYMLTDGIVSIDKKFGLQEVYSCIVQGHARFKRELLRALENKVLLIVLIEDERIASVEEVHTWSNPRRKKWLQQNKKKQAGDKRVRIPPVPPLSSIELQRRMETMHKKYGVNFMFCKKKDTGRVILELLKKYSPII